MSDNKPILPVGNETSFSPIEGETRPGVDPEKITLEDMPLLGGDDEDKDLIIPDGDGDEADVITIDDEEFTLDEDGNAIDADGEIAYTPDEFEFGDDSTGDEPETFEIDGTVFEINEDGEGVDEEGNVVFTNEELDEYEVDEYPEGIVEIDGVIYDVDEDGDALNKDGEVVYTADELSEFGEVDESVLTVKDLMETSNIVPHDEEGIPLEYTNDAEGMRSYIEDVYEAGGLDRAQQIIDARNTQFPLIDLVSDYIIANGSLDGFNEHNFEERTINADTDDATLVSAIREARNLKGDSETEIARLITWAKSDNKLYELATESQDYIDEVSSSKREELAQQAAIRQEQQAKADANYHQTLAGYLENGTVEVDGYEITIPKILEVPDGNGRVTTVDRRELLAYGTEMLQWEMPDGSTQVATRYQIDNFMANKGRTPAKDLLDMLKMFTGQNDIVSESMLQTREAERVSKRLTSNSRRSKARHGSSNNSSGRIILPGSFNH